MDGCFHEYDLRIYLSSLNIAMDLDLHTRYKTLIVNMVLRGKSSDLSVSDIDFYLEPVANVI